MAPPPTSQSRDARKSRAYRARKKDRGQCSRCTRPRTPGFATCPNCRASALARMRDWLARNEGTVEEARHG